MLMLAVCCGDGVRNSKSNSMMPQYIRETGSSPGRHWPQDPRFTGRTGFCFGGVALLSGGARRAFIAVHRRA